MQRRFPDYTRRLDDGNGPGLTTKRLRPREQAQHVQPAEEEKSPEKEKEADTTKPQSAVGEVSLPETDVATIPAAKKAEVRLSTTPVN